VPALQSILCAPEIIKLNQIVKHSNPVSDGT
jgi:hypothetical protein